MAVAHDTRLQQSLKMDPGIERPQSALTRGVQITEFKEAQVNPEPVVLEETDLLLEQFLSPRKLRMLTGIDNLEEIKHLEMKVNTSDTSLGNFGVLLPNLCRLKVSNSTIPRVRDLGSSLRTLTVLWASRCTLLELDGISAMCTLRELYLSYNEISDMSPISMLENIQLLDMEGNNIDDIVQVQYLAICSKLTNLTMEGNPLCVAPTSIEEPADDYDYRQAVKKAIPQLKYLDDELLIEGVGSFQKHNVFDADWAYLEELQKDISLQDDSDSVHSENSSRPPSGNRPSTAALKPNTAYRPGTAMRPSSGFRPLTAKQRPSSTGARPATAIGLRPNSGEERPQSGGAEQTSDASDLTLGKVICGNPSKALLSRRRLNPTASGELDSPPEIQFEPSTEVSELQKEPSDQDLHCMQDMSNFKHTAEHTYDPVPEEERDRSDIVDELKAWKQEHEKRMVKIREERAPQVLKIDHDDAVSLSGDSEVDTEDEDEELSPLRDRELSPLRDSDSDVLQRMSRENEPGDDDLSSFVPASVNSLSPSHSPVQSSSSRDRDHTRDKLRKSRELDTENDNMLTISKSIEKPFKMSDLAARHKNVIPPPSQRDIVRKQTQVVNSSMGMGITNSSLSLGMGSALPPEPRVSSGRSGLRVNSSGLPRPPSSSGPSLSQGSRLAEQDPRFQPVIRSSSLDKPVPPPSQRPSTARASLGILAQQPPKMRRSLPTVPSLLPSKPPAPPK